MLVPNGAPPVLLPMPPMLGPMDIEQSTTVRIRGFPFQTTIEELVQFFDPLLVDFDQENRQIESPVDVIPIINAVDGRPTGEAFIKFKDANDATQALEKNRQKFGNRYVDVFKVPEQEMFMYAVNTFPPGSVQVPPFFVPQDSYMMPPFFPPRALPRRQPVRTNGTSSQHHFQQHLNFTEHVVRVRGLPFTCDEDDIADFFNGINIAPQGIHLILNESNDRSTGEALVEFNTEEDVEKALLRHRQMIGKRYIEVFRSNNGHTEEEEESQNNQNGFVKSKRPPRQNSGRVFFNGKMITTLPQQVGIDGVMLLPMGPMPPHMPMHHKPRNHYYEYSDCTVRMRGLPFSSANDDIIRFFEDYELDPNTIHMRVDNNGRKNGEAYVNFSTPDEAKRAVEERNKCHMGNRYIELFLVGVKHNEGYNAVADQTETSDRQMIGVSTSKT
jgi:RNA recognition motif-containing protein